MDRKALERLIDAAEWTSSKYLSDHQYVKKFEAPELFVEMRAFIKDSGYPGRFLKTTYFYGDVGEYRYWYMSEGPKSIILNRARLDVGGVERP